MYKIRFKVDNYMLCLLGEHEHAQLASLVFSFVFLFVSFLKKQLNDKEIEN